MNGTGYDIRAPAFAEQGAEILSGLPLFPCRKKTPPTIVAALHSSEYCLHKKLLSKFHLSAMFSSVFFISSAASASDVVTLVTPAVSVKRIASSMLIFRGRTALRGISTA